MSDIPEEPPRKGRSNAILTYETVEDIKLGIQEVSLGIKHLDEKVTKADSVSHERFLDHETRLRLLEKSSEGKQGASNFGHLMYANIWPTLMGLIALYNILSHKL